MKASSFNPRQITKKQFKELKAWLEELGDLSGIVHDKKTDQIVGGNQRSRALGIEGKSVDSMMKDGKLVITEYYKKPTKTGTIAEGYFLIKGERYSYRQVDWDEEKIKRAMIIANKAGGEWDMDILSNGFDMDLLLKSGFEIGELVGFDVQPTEEDAEEPDANTVFPEFPKEEEDAEFVNFSFGDYKGRVSKDIYSSFEKEYSNRKAKNESVMIDDVLRGWLNV